MTGDHGEDEGLANGKCRRVLHLIGIGNGFQETVIGRAIVPLKDAIKRIPRFHRVGERLGIWRAWLLWEWTFDKPSQWKPLP